MTSGRSVFATQVFIRSTALSAAWMSTPAAAYAPVAGGGVGSLTTSPCSGVVQDGQGAVGRGAQAHLEQMLSEQALVGERHRVVPGEARQAQRVGGLAGGFH